MTVLGRIKGAWNAFVSTDPVWGNVTAGASAIGSSSSGSRSGSVSRLRYHNEKTIITSIYNRMAIDVASVPFYHVKVDDENRYSETVKSAFNKALTFEPNLDQGPRAFRQDIVMTLFDKGCAAIVPVDTDSNPQTSERFDIHTLRVGEVVTWYPRHVRVSLYNDKTGLREEITLEKRFVAIVENPLYSVMNESNSTLQRLIHKLGLLDAVDEASSSGKLDLIIQLPYVVKTDARREAAEKRSEDIEMQLKGSQYGIAYIDGTEKITQLNRPAENNLLVQVEYLTNMLYDQLGITANVMNGTADEATMINYFNRAVEPILTAILEAMQRAFLGPMGWSADERVIFFRDLFELVPISVLAEIADKFTRNEIFSSNEIRQYMGVKPSADPKADELRNSNMPLPPVEPLALPAAPEPEVVVPEGPTVEEMDGIMNEAFDVLGQTIKELTGGAGGS